MLNTYKGQNFLNDITLLVCTDSAHASQSALPGQIYLQMVNSTYSHFILFQQFHTIIMQDGKTAFDIANAEGHMDVCEELLTQQSS